MNLWKHLTSHFTGNASKTDRGAHAPRVPHSAPPPNASSIPPRSSGREPAPDNSKFNPQNSSFDELNYNRNGKIARLSRRLRDRINLSLYNRCTAKDLARALNQMPEVQAVMAQYFNGQPIKQQNISEWKQGGYRDWLHHRELLEQQRELAADAKDLAGTAKGITDSLFGILTLNYANLMMNHDKETPEEFEKKRKVLSLVSHDIARMHRCHINTRRVEVQETRLDRDQEKTTEQLHFKFMEWAENPAIRRACILEPMEANRQTRKHMGMPPTSDDILVEKLTRNDPYFNPPPKKQTKYKPKPTEKPHPEAESPAAEKAPGSNNDSNRPPATPSPGGPNERSECRCGCCSNSNERSECHGGCCSDVGRGEGELNSKLNPQNSPLPPNPYGDKTTSQIIAEIEAGGTGTSPAPESKPEPAPSPASEKTPDTQVQKDTVGTRSSASEADRQVSPATSQSEGAPKTDSPIRPIRPLSPIPPSPKPKTQPSTLPKTTPPTPNPYISEYERALREGKPFLEALHIHITSKTKPTPPLPGTRPGDNIWEIVRPSPYPYAHFSPPPASSFKLTFG